jgi:KaiC/GvpD/RAD55 family RecA-like ATPase
MAAFWLGQIGDYYERDHEAKAVSRDTLRSIGLGAVAATQVDSLGTYLDGLKPVSAANVLADIIGHKRSQEGLRLAQLLTNPESDLGLVRETLDGFASLCEAAERGTRQLSVLDTDEVHSAYDPETIVPLYPKPLRSQCMGGGAQPGHHILIFGRPEAGKSLMAIHMAAGAAHAGKKVLYFGNEESVRTHYTRMACNLAGRKLADFQDNGDAIIEVANSRGLQNVTFIELTPGTLAEVEQGIVQFKPNLVVVDQLAGLDVGESNPVRAIDRAARGFRTLLLKHGIVGLSVSQAGDRTERHGQLPPAFLSMGDVYGSRTGLPAQVDLMIGIGYDQEMYDRDVRGVSLPKNKLGGSHTPFKIRIDKQMSRVRSLS